MGINALSHDAAVTVIEGEEILFAAQAERYSRRKNDQLLNDGIISEALSYGKPDRIAYFERPYRKKHRQLISGQYSEILNYKNIPRHYLKKYVGTDIEYVDHHKSHAAAGYYTAPFDDCNIIVIDAIGEWDTISIWDNMKKIKSWKYPYSLGLLYSAITQRIGLKPNEDEYITMGMVAFGEPIYDLTFLLDQNNHQGVGDIFKGARNEDLAASVQALYEKELLKLVNMCPKKNLILMGGCALNCVANSKIEGKNIWIMPSPGDSGSSLGAAAALQKRKLNWVDPYLGHEIKGVINPLSVVKELKKNKVCGVANGKAEFGPRALGNRSLLGDPRRDIKDIVNIIKRRQKFRPFAPSILEEYADDYFDGPMNEYMQFVAKAKHPYDSVTHVDGTARVHLVKKSCKSIIRPILEEWYNQTGCPMLLNTSLNIKGEPIVNTKIEGEQFSKKYEVKIY